MSVVSGVVEAELLAAIAGAPDDDEPRLVYADHLMQRGDPRGEFIALQCRIARADADSRALEPAVISRERTLREKHAERWTEPLRAIVEAGYVFRRGFVEHAAVWSERSLQHHGDPVIVSDRLATLLAAEPLLRSIGINGGLVETSPVPSLRELRALTVFSTRATAKQTSAFVGELHALQRLHLTCADLDDARAHVWLGITRPLDHLGVHGGWHVSRTPQRTVIADLIAANPALRGLRSLHLGGFTLGTLSPFGCLSQLERLVLHRTGETLESIVALVKQLPRLAMLELDNDDKLLGRLHLPELLAAAPLRRLVLRGCKIGPRHLEALAASALTHLELEYCNVNGTGIQQLLAGGKLISLRVIDHELPADVVELVRKRDRFAYDPPPPAYPPAVMEPLPDNKIDAIKEWRATSGMGLAESKMAIERICEEHGWFWPHGYRTTSRWCRP